MDSKKGITVSKKISGDQDGDATLFGAVLTSHASRLFEMTQCQYRNVRFASLDLVGNLLRQGQLNPNEAVPFLLALQGDVDAEEVRVLALGLLMAEGEKRPDMIRQRVCAGVKQAYKFQTTAYPEKDEPSALLKIQQNGTYQWQCVFGSVFKECIVTIKKERQGLFRNLIGLFDMEARRGEAEVSRRKKKIVNLGVNPINLPLLAFAAQVLAHLPYAASSDPLYIIHHISSNLALQAPDLLDRLSSFLRPFKLSSSDEYDETNAEEDDLERASQCEVPHCAKEAAPLLLPEFDGLGFANLCCEAAGLVLLLRLKRFLRKAYNLTESRCLAFDPQAKERVAEKSISKSSLSPFDSKLPLKECPTVETNVDFDALILQYSEFRILMRDEAAVAESRSGESDDEEELVPSAKKSKRKRDAQEDEDDEDT
jgi:cohesin loading factor subunit SCC2